MSSQVPPRVPIACGTPIPLARSVLGFLVMRTPQVFQKFLLPALQLEGDLQLLLIFDLLHHLRNPFLVQLPPPSLMCDVNPILPFREIQGNVRVVIH